MYRIQCERKIKMHIFVSVQNVETRFGTSMLSCKSMKIGPNFLGFLYYREQEAGKGEGDGGKTTATQPGSGQAQDQSSL